MTDQEYVCLDGDDVVVNIIVVGDGDATELINAYGYARTIPTATYGKPVIGSRLIGDLWQPPQPFASWTWDGSDWQPPVPRPDSEGVWMWDEDMGAWINLTADSE